jgi:hypothetical protein
MMIYLKTGSSARKHDCCGARTGDQSRSFSTQSRSFSTAKAPHGHRHFIADWPYGWSWTRTKTHRVLGSRCNSKPIFGLQPLLQDNLKNSQIPP